MPAALLAADWDEFWTASGVKEGASRENNLAMAESVANIAPVLPYVFQRNAYASPSETVLVSSRISQHLEACFTGQLPWFAVTYMGAA